MQASRVQSRRPQTAWARPDGPVQGKEYLAHLGEAFHGHGLTAHARAHLIQVGQLTVVRQAQKRLEGDVRFQRSPRRRNGMCRNLAFGQGFKPHLARRFRGAFFQFVNFDIQTGKRGGQTALTRDELFPLAAQDVQRVGRARQR